MLARIEAAALRGLGGAGFPAARKWKLVRATPGPRHVVVNADEGEPGTFKDRYCLETEPHRVLEGMLLAAQAVEAEACWIYLRDEYPHLRHALEREIAALAHEGMVRTPIHLRRGAGAYICGEETALLESLEGRRGYPRHKPPFPGQVGLFGQPTLIHNVETLWFLPEILGSETAGAEYAARGRRGRQGLRFFSVSGRVRDPGEKLAPPASPRGNWWRNMRAACCRAIASPPTCPAAPRAASCPNASRTCRLISARSTPRAASSAPARW
jgi:NADH:ubiquinone oxidoreductase subunit F (NADH-binding)